MSDPMLEGERSLAAFRSHIKNLQDRLRGKDATVVQIDCNALTAEDEAVWHEYLSKLAAMIVLCKELESGGSSSDFEIKLNAFIDELKKGIIATVQREQQRLSGAVEVGRAYFYAWCANRLGIALNLYAIQGAIRRGTIREFTVQELSEMITELDAEYKTMKL